MKASHLSDPLFHKVMHDICDLLGYFLRQNSFWDHFRIFTNFSLWLDCNTCYYEDYIVSYNKMYEAVGTHQERKSQLQILSENQQQQHPLLHHLVASLFLLADNQSVGNGRRLITFDVGADSRSRGCMKYQSINQINFRSHMLIYSIRIPELVQVSW